MERTLLNNLPLEGKTYSLFGSSENTDNYFHIIKQIADNILSSNPDINRVVATLQKYSSKKHNLKKAVINKRNDSEIFTWLNLLETELNQFTINTESHLKTLSIIKKIRDRRLATTREQYHLYMLEIELRNRLNAEEFKKSEVKIALLPHCLQDFSSNCKSAINGFDYQCRHCSAKCYLNHTSVLLAKNQIEPYIWMEGSLKEIAKQNLKSGKSFAVLGIACIPELTWGMRNCSKQKIPVAGLPLNANRCRRWFGEFLPNSVNLIELEKLIN